MNLISSICRDKLDNIKKDMEKIKDFLAKLPLSAKEIEVYLAGLKHGAMHATEIAKICMLTRPNAYDVVKKLQEKGLVYQLGSLYGRKFKMATPEELRTLITRRKEEQKELEHELDSLLPLMESIRGKHHEPYPRVEYFEGVEGIKNLIEKTLTTEEKIIKTATAVKSWDELLSREFTNYYVQRRVDKKITSFTLRSEKGELNDPFYQQHKKQMREVRYAPPGIKIDCTIMLFDDKVALVTTKREKLGLILQSKSYSQTFQSWFDFLWQNSKSK